MKKNSMHKSLKIILTLAMTCFSILVVLSAPRSPSAFEGIKASDCSKYLNKAFELLDNDNHAALNAARIAYRCALIARDTLSAVKSGELIAKAYRRLGLLDSAEHIARSLVTTARAKDYVNELQNLLHGMAIVYLLKADFDRALEYSFECLELRKRYGTQVEVGNTRSNIGLIYYKLGDYRKALEYYSEARIALHTESRQAHDYAQLLVNIALCHAYLKSYSEALKFADESISACGDGCPAIVTGNVEFCKGIVSFGQQNFENARVHFLASYNLSESTFEDRLALDNIIYLTKLCLSNNELPKAEFYLMKAERLMRHGTPYSMEQMKIYSEFAALYEVKGDYKKVADFQRRHMALKDSIYDDEVTTRLMRIEANHVEQEKNARISAQNERIALNEKIIFRQRIATILAIITIALSAGFIVLLVRSIREKKSRNADLEVRVRKRTRELEALVDQSQRLYTEKKLWFDKILSAVRHTTNTVNGLSSLASKDADSNEKCIALIEHEMNQLLTHVNSYVSRSSAGITNGNDEL